MSNISNLKDKLRQIGLLKSARALLSWDQETYMPDGAGEFRSHQMSYLSTLIHNKLTSEQFSKILENFVTLDNGQLIREDISTKEKSMIKEVYRDYKIASSLPETFVGKLSSHSSESIQVWRKARRENNFAQFKPYLEKMIELQKQKANYLGYDDQPYDALLDLYEPEMTTEKIKQIFDPVKDKLTTLAKRIRRSSLPVDDSFLNQEFPPQNQRDFVEEMLQTLGYNFNQGRIDESTHPFTTGFHPTDTRITILFDKRDLTSSINASIHEGGHGLYEQGLNQTEFGNPLGEAMSSGIHESQSRLWENVIGSSKPFWNHWLPRLKDHFPQKLNEVTLEQWHKAYNKVEPTLIRVEADEVHYNLHILLRLEIEEGLINNDLDVADLPQVWNQKMEDYIGVTPPNDTKGVLQDVHWSWGLFGYFPTYSLGNFYSAQIFNAALNEIEGLWTKIETGKFKDLKNWLTDNLYKKGRGMKPDQLIQELCGQKPRPKSFLHYLQKKYSQIYDL